MYGSKFSLHSVEYYLSIAAFSRTFYNLTGKPGELWHLHELQYRGQWKPRPLKRSSKLLPCVVYFCLCQATTVTLLPQVIIKIMNKAYENNGQIGHSPLRKHIKALPGKWSALI